MGLAIAENLAERRGVRLILKGGTCLVIALAAALAATPYSWSGIPGPGLAVGQKLRLDAEFSIRSVERTGTRMVVLEQNGRLATPTGSSRLLLNVGEFDPLTERPPGIDAAGDPRFRIVQLAVDSVQPVLDRLRAAGAEPLAFLPERAYICRMKPGAVDNVSKLPFVRWTGVLPAAARISPEALTATGPADYEMLPLGPLQPELLRQLRSLGVKPSAVSPGSGLVKATLSPKQLLAVQRIGELQWIERAQTPSADMDIARQIGGADFLSRPEVGSYNGEGVRGEVLDLGVRETHVAFQSRELIVRSNNNSKAHGTSTTGIVFGDGTGNELGKGMLPAGQGIFASFVGMEDRYSHTKALLSEPYKAVFQSNSWGTGSSKNYTIESYVLDKIAFDTDLLICQSMGNFGSQLARPEAWAKNVVSVGGINHQNTLDRADDYWSGASIGPARDGRIKPDFSHFNDAVLCPTGESDYAYRGDFAGTSASTPIVAGHFGLLYQMWADGAFGNSVLADSVFDARPSSTLARALMANTASPYDFGGREDNLSRFKQGWGLPDLTNMWNQRQNTFFLDRRQPLKPHEQKVYFVYVPPGTKSFRATMAFRDPPGSPLSSRDAVNDLSLQVTGPNRVGYWGNSGLDAANKSSGAGTRDRVNTLEQVWIDNPASGVWSINVSADQINVDGRPETPGVLDADFSLVVTGGLIGAYANKLEVTEGSAGSLSLSPLETSDNRRLLVSGVSSVQAIAYSQIPLRVIRKIRLKAELNAGVPGLRAKLESYSYDLGKWIESDSVATNGGDQVLAVTLNSPSLYSDPQTGEVKCRITVQPQGLSPGNIRVSIDQIRWELAY